MKLFHRPSEDSPTLAAIRQSILQTERRDNGRRAENAVRDRLIELCVKLIEHPEPVMHRARDGKTWYDHPVSGDWRGVIPPSGRSLLVEVKSTAGDGNLLWSAFRKHQPEKLDEHEAAGGETWLVWIAQGVPHWIPWARVRELGFCPRTSLVWGGKEIRLSKEKK